MESRKVLVLVLIAAAAIAFMAPSSNMGVDAAFGIEMNPCTIAECIADCKKALKEKYTSATCAASSKGKFCICLG